MVVLLSFRPLFLSCLLSCLLLLPSSSSGASVSGGGEVSYQIHSYDDLREWSQVIAKGGRWFKFDLNYQGPEFCQTPNSRAVERVDPRTSKYGCILLNHDTPTLERETPYFTANDILEYINDNPVAFTQPDAPITIALCMKYSASSNMCDGTPAAHNVSMVLLNWLVRELIVSSDFDNWSVEFLLDGAFTPSKGRECMSSFWKGSRSMGLFNETYILDQDPSNGYVSNSPEDGSDRFQVNNMDELSFFVAIGNGYGKFANPEKDTNGYTKSYPYLLWEPSDQATLLSLTSAYLAGPRHIVPNDPAGLRYAINIDPVQFEVYTGSLTGNAWNMPVTNSRQHVFPKVGVWVTPVPSPSSMTSPTSVSTSPVMLIVYYDRSISSFVFQTYSFNWILSKPWPIYDQPQTFVLPTGMVQAYATGEITSMSVLDVIDPSEGRLLVGQPVRAGVVFGDSSGFITIMDSMNLKTTPPLWTGSFPNTGKFSQMSASYLQMWSGDSSIFFLHATESETCALLIRPYMLNNLGQLVILETSAGLGGEICLLQTSDIQISSSDVSLSTIPSSDPTFCHGTTPLTKVFQAFFVTYSLNGIVYGSIGCLGFGQYSSVFTSSQPSELGVGRRPSVTLKQRPADVNTNQPTPYAMLTLGDGYCYNNEFTNKRPDIALCDSQPMNQSQVLTYSYGTLQSFDTMILNRTERLSPCLSNGIIHGMYDMGSSSNVQLFVGPTSETNLTDMSSWGMGVVEVHVGYAKPTTTTPTTMTTMTNRRADHDSASRIESIRTRATDRASANVITAPEMQAKSGATPTPIPASFCGEAVPHDGIIVDSWRLPNV